MAPASPIDLQSTIEPRSRPPNLQTVSILRACFGQEGAEIASMEASAQEGEGSLWPGVTA